MVNKQENWQHNWTPEIGAYLDELYAEETDGLRDAARAIRESGMPQIQILRSDGRLLELLLRMIGARRAIEVGTLGAYSTQWLARGLADDGHLWSIELSATHARVARDVLARAGLSERVTVCQGAGLDVLPTLERHGPFDAVFVDADKEGYPAYAAWAIANLRRGGLLIGDNTYLFGRLVGATPRSDDDQRTIDAMRRFHQLVASQMDGMCIPTAEGLTVGIKR